MDNLTEVAISFAKLELLELQAGIRELHQCPAILGLAEKIKDSQPKKERMSYGRVPNCT